MENIFFTDDNGTFSIKQPENYSYLYFPIAAEQGIKSAVTPNLGGDIKTDGMRYQPGSGGLLPVGGRKIYGCYLQSFNQRDRYPDSGRSAVRGRRGFPEKE